MAVRALVWVGLLLALLRGVRAIPQSRVLTNSTATAILRKLSTPKGEVLFTTTGLPPNGSPGTVDMLDNFCYHLEKIGMLKHALILTPSESCVHRRPGWQLKCSDLRCMRGWWRHALEDLAVQGLKMRKSAHPSPPPLSGSLQDVAHSGGKGHARVP